jgi:selenocysteine lyase/cysteine desulfurase
VPMLQKEWVRSQLPATGATTYLNNGTYGPLPRCADEAIAAAARFDVEKGRISGGMAAFVDYQAERTALRSALGRIVGADDTEIALTRSTTEGVNIGLWGRPWSAGDEVVTTSQEHPGVLVPLAVLHARYGVKVTLADIGGGESDRTLEAMTAAIRPGVKMVVLSHVVYTTGAVLPLREITKLAHAVGATVHVDGAQSVGAIAVDVRDLGVDTYAFSGQKWLCGPDSSGGLYVAPEQMDQLAPTSVSFTTIDFQQFDPHRPLDVAINPTAARYETGTMYRPAVKGFAASIRWLTNEVGLNEALAAINELSGYCRQEATQIPGVRVLTPSDQTSGLVSLQIGPADVDGAVAYLAQEGISIRSVHENHALRISTGFYNTREEIDRTLGLVRTYIQSA